MICPKFEILGVPPPPPRNGSAPPEIFPSDGTWKLHSKAEAEGTGRDSGRRSQRTQNTNNWYKKELKVFWTCCHPADQARIQGGGRGAMPPPPKSEVQIFTYDKGGPL